MSRKCTIVSGALCSLADPINFIGAHAGNAPCGFCSLFVEMLYGHIVRKVLRTTNKQNPLGSFSA